VVAASEVLCLVKKVEQLPFLGLVMRERRRGLIRRVLKQMVKS
jgi:hypothetical protein